MNKNVEDEQIEEIIKIKKEKFNNKNFKSVEEPSIE